MAPREIGLKALDFSNLFLDLFPIQKSVVDALEQAMRRDGFDPASPVRVWPVNGKLLVVDGHMRLQAAGRAGLETVWIQEMAFADTKAAFEWACAEQGERRRNLSRVEVRKFVLRAVRTLDALRPRGGDHKSAEYQQSKGSREPIDRSATQIAKRVGTSASTVKAIRKIDRHGDPAARAALEAGASPRGLTAKSARSRAPSPSPPRPASAPRPPAPVAPRSPDTVLAELPERMRTVLKRVAGAILRLIPPLERGPESQRLAEYLGALAQQLREGGGTRRKAGRPPARTHTSTSRTGGAS